MKIRLIQPAQLDENGKPTRFEKLFFPMLTLPTLAALTPADVEVGITMEYVEDIDFDEKADMVGITAQTCQATRAYQVAAEFRKRGVRTIMGGIHASVCPDEAAAHVDSVCIGEAEELWPQILADARAGRLKPRYEATEKPSLERLAIPRFDLLDFKQYVIPPFARTPLIPIQTMRGCPNHCDFCSVSQFLGRQIRTKPVANVMREIESVRPSRVFFVDDNIAADPSYALNLCGALKPLKMRWACQMSTQILNYPELIDAAAESGCHETFIGLETLNQNTLNGMRKGFNRVGDYERLFRRLSDVGILAQVALIAGLDGDTAGDLRYTIEVIMSLDINYVYITALTPLPGTELRERLLKEGRVGNAGWELYDFSHVVVEPKNMSRQELEDVLWEMYRKFYSLKGIIGRAWRFRRQYLLFFPRDSVIEEVFFQTHQRKAVQRKTYPFTLGLRKDSS